MGYLLTFLIVAFFVTLLYMTNKSNFKSIILFKVEKNMDWYVKIVSVFMSVIEWLYILWGVYNFYCFIFKFLNI